MSFTILGKREGFFPISSNKILGIESPATPEPTTVTKGLTCADWQGQGTCPLGSGDGCGQLYKAAPGKSGIGWFPNKKLISISQIEKILTREKTGTVQEERHQ